MLLWSEQNVKLMERKSGEAHFFPPFALHLKTSRE
jgi:hypothetical protein